MQPLRLATVVALLSIAFPAAAADVRVDNLWARATAPGQKTAGIYAEFTSTADAALVSAASPLAARVELHSTTVDGGVMRMRSLDRIELPALKTVKLAPNGLHLMAVDLTRPLKPGEKLPLELRIQASGGAVTTIKIDAEVRARTAAPAHVH
jgi:periplasmic copper chaperone A